MTWLARHLIAVAFVACAVVATGIALASARSVPPPGRAMPSPPRDLPYHDPVYSAADARRAFASIGVKLEHGHGPNAANGPVTIVGSMGHIVEVDAFGDPQAMSKSGFSNYVFVNEQWVRVPTKCGGVTPYAALWRGNVRAVVTCSHSAAASRRWLDRTRLALANL